MSRPGPGAASWRPAVAGLGAAVSVAVLALVMHFGRTRNWAGVGWTAAAFLAFLCGLEVWCRVAHKRATGTYSYDPARVQRVYQGRLAQVLDRNEREWELAERARRREREARFQRERDDCWWGL